MIPTDSEAIASLNEENQALKKEVTFWRDLAEIRFLQIKQFQAMFRQASEGSLSLKRGR